jgi:hypothetical protein
MPVTEISEEISLGKWTLLASIRDFELRLAQIHDRTPPRYPACALHYDCLLGTMFEQEWFTSTMQNEDVIDVPVSMMPLREAVLPPTMKGWEF